MSNISVRLSRKNLELGGSVLMNKKSVFSPVILAFAVLLATGCDNGLKPKDDGKGTVEPAVYYRVTFDTDGGSDVLLQKVGENETAYKPRDPKKPEFIFRQWSLTDTDDKFDFDNTKITQDITLKASWEEAGLFEFDTEISSVTGFTKKGFDANTQAEGKLEVPAEIAGYKVLKIGDSAFNTASKANPDNSGMTKLIEVNLPDTLVSISQNAFRYNSLTEVTIPDSVTSIGSYAFADNSLETVTIPNGVTSIDSYAFSTNSLGTVIIPNSITSIGSYAFTKNSLTSVIIPGSVKTIGSSAFANNSLETVAIPNSVTSIGSSAFANNSLKTVTIPNSITSISQSAFQNNRLTAVTIPDSITSIGNGAFLGNSFTEVRIPDTVTSIESGAFSSNPDLTKVSIGSGITVIPSSLFGGSPLPSITSITIGAKVTVPPGQTGILEVANAMGKYHISFRDYYTYAYGKAGVYTTKDGTAWEWNGQPIEVPKILFDFEPRTGTINGFNADGVAENNQNGGKLVIPAQILETDVKAIKASAFAGLSTKLTGLELPETITNIGASAFANNSLKAVKIPDSVTQLGSSAFGNNPVETVVIGKGITVIPSQLFAGGPTGTAPSITGITIGENVTIPAGTDSNEILQRLNALGLYHVSFASYYRYAKQAAGKYTTGDSGKTWKKDDQTIPEPKVDLEYDFASAGSFVPGTDYETAAGKWEVKDGRLYFDNNNNDAKLKFLKSADMVNSIIELDIGFTAYYSNGGGNGGPVLHMDRMREGGDELDGYYVGTGRNGAVPDNYHFESAWFSADPVDGDRWHGLWGQENTNISYNEELVHLVLTVIEGKANLKVYDKSGVLKREIDGNTSDGRGAPPDSGFAGIRVWNCAGWIDNVKITNVGDGLDFNN